jgi:cell division protein FtsL
MAVLTTPRRTRQAPSTQKQRRSRPRAPSTRRRVLLVGLLVAALVLAFAYCAGYARMWKLDSDYRKLQEELRRLQAQRETIENRIVTLTAPSRLTEYALAHGMVRDPAVPYIAQIPAPTPALTGMASIALTAPGDGARSR